MRNALLVTACVAGVAQAGSAAVVFGISQAVPGPIPVNSTAEFTVTVYSNAGTINNFAGADFVLDANDPAFTGTSTAGGRFTAGTNVLFAPNGGFALPFPSSFQVYGANAGTGLSLGTVPTTLATLTLSTAGASGGTYNMRLSSLLAVDPLFDSIPIVAPTPLSYTIVVPEPTSLAAFVGVGMFLRRRR